MKEFILARLKEKSTYVGGFLFLSGLAHLFVKDPYIDGILTSIIMLLGGKDVVTPEAARE